MYGLIFDVFVPVSKEQFFSLLNYLNCTYSVHKDICENITTYTLYTDVCRFVFGVHIGGDNE